MAAVVCKGAWWLLMVLVWGYWTFLKTFTQRLHLKLPMVICSSFLKGFGDVHAYRLSIHSISHKVHCWSRKCIFFVFWTVCSRIVGSSVFKRNVFVKLYFSFFYYSTNSLLLSSCQILLNRSLSKAAVPVCHNELQPRKPSDALVLFHELQCRWLRL